MKITQKMMAFYKLYIESQKDSSLENYIPAWAFVGEIEIKEIGLWVFMSYKCPARLSDLYKENPHLMDRKLLTGKSGSKYYGYRLNFGTLDDLVQDQIIKDFYLGIKYPQKFAPLEPVYLTQ